MPHSSGGGSHSGGSHSSHSSHSGGGSRHSGGGSSSSSSSSSASVIYYYVTLDVDDPDNVLLPAMTARVEINTAEKNDALVVPLSTLKTDIHGSYVIVKNDDGTQENRYVSTGIYSDEYVEILEGLSEGEQVVSTYVAKASTTSSSKKNDRGGPPPM